MDQFGPDDLGEIIVAEADRADGNDPERTDVYRRWEQVGGPEAWGELQRIIYVLGETGQMELGDFSILESLGITGQRAHIAMDYLKRRDERLAELEEEGFVEQG